MKRSAAVPLVLVTAAAAALTSCKPKPTRYCVDANNVVVDDEKCREEQHAAAGYPYHWYYGGGGGRLVPGTRVSGGSTSDPALTSRGVIGAAGEAAGSGGHGSGEAGE